MRDSQWKKSRQQILLLLIASLIIISSACTNYAWRPGQRTVFDQAQKSIKYSEFIQQIKQCKIKNVGLSSDRTKALITDNDELKTVVNIPPNENKLIDMLAENSVEIYVISD